jgi:guanylate kinase
MPAPEHRIVPLLVVLSAPSGAGKTTLCRELLARNPNFSRAITCTTRAPRGGEKPGEDYYFLEAADFLKRVQAGHFLEHATVHGHSYGTLKSEVLGKLRAGRDVILAIDVQGAASVRAAAETDGELRASLVTVFLTPESLGVLEARLKKRNEDPPEVIQRRLNVARHEIAQWRQYDYLLISTTIAEDARRMQAIVDAEKMRQSRAVPPQL